MVFNVPRKKLGEIEPASRTTRQAARANGDPIFPSTTPIQKIDHEEKPAAAISQPGASNRKKGIAIQQLRPGREANTKNPELDIKENSEAKRRGRKVAEQSIATVGQTPMLPLAKKRRSIAPSTTMRLDEDNKTSALRSKVTELSSSVKSTGVRDSPTLRSKPADLSTIETESSIPDAPTLRQGTGRKVITSAPPLRTIQTLPSSSLGCGGAANLSAGLRRRATLPTFKTSPTLGRTAKTPASVVRKRNSLSFALKSTAAATATCDEVSRSVQSYSLTNSVVSKTAVLSSSLRKSASMPSATFNRRVSVPAPTPRRRTTTISCPTLSPAIQSPSLRSEAAALRSIPSIPPCSPSKKVGLNMKMKTHSQEKTAVKKPSLWGGLTRSNSKSIAEGKCL